MHTKTLIYFSVLFFALMMKSCGPAAEDGRQEHVPYPKNVIFFIGDGMGYNHVLATNYYLYGEANMQLYEQDDWLQLAQATYNAARLSKEDTIFHTGYAPRTAWEDADYLNNDYTDSGAAATALSTGQKVMSHSIGIAMNGDTLTHVSQAAKARGKSIGLVASVPFSHATPAGFAAHNHSRRNLEEIAKYLFFHTRLDVIMAPGHPDYNNDGEPEEMSARYVGGRDIWEQLTTNEGRMEFEDEQGVYQLQDANGDGLRDPWHFIDAREDFLAMASGPVPGRVLGVPKAYSTLNQNRSRGEGGELPFGQPLNENVPTLEELTRASLHVLSQNPQGFFVMIEGGAIDWAGHDNDLVRLIEEQADFNHAVRAAVEWVETHSHWGETLVIVTSDHETGYLTGPGHPGILHDAVENGGRGQLPGVGWNSGSHTNMLVPFYAKGPGTELFSLMAGEVDPVKGPFLQNTDIAQALFLMWGKPDIPVHRLN